MWDILNNLLVVAGQVVTLFLLMGVGFVMAKLGRLSPSTLGQLSNLLLYVAIPCVIISSMQIDPDPVFSGTSASCSSSPWPTTWCSALWCPCSSAPARRTPG